MMHIATTRHTAHAGHRLQNGRALVITGPQGCGKGALARMIAAAHGPYVEIDAGQFETVRATEAALNTEPAVLVVEGLPRSEQALTRIKALITSSRTVLPSRHGSPKREIKTPRLIFCAGADVDDSFLLEPGRRFYLIQL
jgi:ABC-type cobalamin/Fe3+-siderophores transport system ATPase subunit